MPFIAQASPKAPVVETTPINNAFGNDDVFLLNLSISQMSMTRKVPSTAVSVNGGEGTDLTALKVSKIILDCDELTAIHRLYREIRDFAEDYEIPCSGQFRAGMYLMSYKALDKIEERMADATEQLELLIDQLLEAYEDRKAEAKDRLTVLYNDDDYPAPEKIRERYTVKYGYQTLATPEGLAKFKGDIFKREQEKLRRVMQEAVADSRQIIAAQAREMASKVIERLTPGEDGKPKVFRDSLLNNWTEFIDMFDLKDVSGDTDLRDILHEVKAKIEGRKCDDLRKSTEVSDDIKALFESVTARLDEMVIDKPIRKMRVED